MYNSFMLKKKHIKLQKNELNQILGIFLEIMEKIASTLLLKSL